MKILLVFIDMIRVDHLSLYNEKIEKTALDSFFVNLGGTVLTNCYTPAPDTPRSIACMQTGLLPYFNGCDTRMKWPRYYIKPNVATIFDSAVSHGYSLNLCATKLDIETGLFKYQKSNNINLFTDIDSFFRSSQLTENTLSFIALDDYHSTIDDYGGTELGITKGQEVIEYFFDKYLNTAFIEQYDCIFFFSDHGHATEQELIRKKTKLDLLKNARTQLLMFYHISGDKKIIKDHRLASILDLYASLIDLIEGKNNHRQGYSFFVSPQRTFLHIEDHSDFRVSPEQIISQWRVISDSVDIRTNVKETIDAVGNDADLDLVYKDLCENSPSFYEYVKQLKILQRYESMKKRNSSYFVGIDRISLLRRFVFKINNKIKRILLKHLFF